MNAERLHAIAAAIVSDFSKTQILQNLQQLINSLTNLIQQPGNAQFQQQVANNKKAALTSLDNSELNDFSPAWRQTALELGGQKFFDDALKEEIESLFSRNQITPSEIRDSLQKILTDAQGWVQAIESVNSGFSRLQIGKEDLQPGQCELGTLIPRAYVENRLDRFSNELSQLNKIYGVFSEISTGSRPGFSINTISSSDLTIYLDAAPPVCACIAVAIERIVALYKNLLEIRKLQGELKKQGLPEQALSGVQDHANSYMKNGIEDLAKDIVGDFDKIRDEGRKNEISIELTMALKQLADRIDRGFNIEVRMAAPDPQDPSTPANEDEVRSFEKIKAAEPNMKFLKLSGEPILKLSNGENETDAAS